MDNELDIDRTANERLLESLPEIGQELDRLWRCFANRYICFAGGGNFNGELQPDELGLAWAGDVNSLLGGCEALVSLRDEEEATEWGEMIVLLSDLVDELNFYFGPFWNQVSDEERDRAGIRMDMNAQKLLAIFRARGYIKAETKPFKLED